MVTRFSPTKKGRQEDQARVYPDQTDADSQATRGDQLVIGERLCYSEIAIHTDASKTRHRHAFEHRDDISENLTSQGLVDTCWVVEQ